MAKIRQVLAYEGLKKPPEAGGLSTRKGVEWLHSLKSDPIECVGDVNRFGSGEQLCSYAGIVPSTRSSSGIARRGRITRQGSRSIDLMWRMPIEARSS